MIADSTTTEDLIATFGAARALGAYSFEQGCAVLEAIEMFDTRTADGELGTWREYSLKARGALPFVPSSRLTPESLAHRRVCERLAQTIVHWAARQFDSSALTIGALFTAWVVIDKATRVAWVECSPAKNQHAQHPRNLREAGEFPSSSQGTVDAYVFLRMGEAWREVLDSVLTAYHEAKRALDGEDA